VGGSKGSVGGDVTVEEAQRLYETMLVELLVAMGRIAVAPPSAAEARGDVSLAASDKRRKARRDSLSFSVGGENVDSEAGGGFWFGAAATASARAPGSDEAARSRGGGSGGGHPRDAAADGVSGGGAALLLVLDGAEHLDACGWRVVEGIAQRLKAERRAHAKAAARAKADATLCAVAHSAVADARSRSGGGGGGYGYGGPAASAKPAPLSRLLLVVALRPLEAHRPRFEPVPPAYLRLRRASEVAFPPANAHSLAAAVAAAVPTLSAPFAEAPPGAAASDEGATGTAAAEPAAAVLEWAFPVVQTVPAAS
jgi:hypothetical protein